MRLLITALFVLIFPVVLHNHSPPTGVYQPNFFKQLNKDEGYMSYDSNQFRLKIRETLKQVGLWTPSAEELLMLTAATESNLGEYITQVNGPAKGAFQIEPTTFHDINNNYLRYNAELADRIRGVIGDLEIDELENDIRAQIIYARLVYLRAPTNLPGPKDIPGLANYWKLNYNTRLGKGVVAEAIKKYNKYVKKGENLA